MRSGRWEGTATAVTSISHGGETLGTITYLRREAFLTPQGRMDIPVVSGNAVRGVLRDTAAHLLWEALGQPALPMPVMHALWAGGALVKAKTQPLTGQRLSTLRAMVAHIGVFGAAGGGRIIDGALTVGKMVPICAQTAHLLPPHLTETTHGNSGALPDIHDLLQIERYSRIPDLDRLPHISNPAPDALNPPPAANDSTDDGLMRYGAETFVAGTQFHTFFALNNASPTEHAYFHEVLDTWTQDPTVGGKTGRGHGRVRYDLTYTGAPVDPAPDSDWRRFNGADIEEVLRTLNWLD